MVFLLPFDLATARYEYCLSTIVGGGDGGSQEECIKSFAVMSKSLLSWTWMIAYWFIFWSTWIAIPFLQGYVVSGEFGIWEKSMDSLKSNLMFYMSSLGVLFIVIIYLLFGTTTVNTWSGIISLLMTISNAFGLMVAIACLGHGLVEIPRNIWNSADRTIRLTILERKAPLLREEMMESQDELANTIREVISLNDRTDQEGQAFRSEIDSLINCLPSEISNDDALVALATSSSSSNNPYQNSRMIPFYEPVTKKYLVNLHYRLHETISKRDRCKSAWENLCRDAFDIQDNLLSGNFWSRHLDYPFRKVMGFICAILSLFILWSECSLAIQTPIDLSIINLLVHWKRTSPFFVEIIAFSFFLYLSICCYSSFMKIRIFSYYRLVPHHTDQKSLLFFAAYFSRISFPLGYNYLSLIEGSRSGRLLITQFSRIMGTISFNYMNIYVPCLLIFMCLLVYGKWYDGLVKFLTLSTQYGFYDDGDGDEIMMNDFKNNKNENNINRSMIDTDNLRIEGRNLIQEEKQRLYNRQL